MRRSADRFILAPVAGLALALTVGGCATVQEVAADVVLPPDQEIQLGHELSARVEQEARLVQDPAVQRYVQNLGDHIVRATGNERPEIDYTFKVIDDPEMINAFALPGGYVYIYSGLIQEAESEAELMSVLGHEVAHVTKRHVAERLAAMYGAQVLTAVAFGQDPSVLEQIVSSIFQNGYLLKYSRDQEREADLWGVHYLINAGWNPQGFISFFRKLQRESTMPTFLLSHPQPQERIDRVQSFIQRYERLPTRDDRVQFQQMQQRLRSRPVARLGR